MPSSVVLSSQKEWKRGAWCTISSFGVLAPKLQIGIALD